MKKFIAMMLCIILTLSLVACGGNTEETTEPTTEPTTESVVETEATEELTEEEYLEDETYDENGLDAETLEALENPYFEYVSVDADGMWNPTEATDSMLLIHDVMMTLPVEQRFASYVVYEVLHENYETDVYFTYEDGFETVLCQSAFSFQPQFVYLIQAPEGTDVEALCAQIEANADPYRTQCPPFVEFFGTAHSGNTILFAMCQTAESLDSLLTGFNTVMGQ